MLWCPALVMGERPGKVGVLSTMGTTIWLELKCIQRQTMHLLWGPWREGAQPYWVEPTCVGLLSPYYKQKTRWKISPWGIESACRRKQMQSPSVLGGQNGHHNEWTILLFAKGPLSFM